MAAKRKKKRRTITRASLERKMEKIQTRMYLTRSPEERTKLEREYNRTETDWAKKLNAERKAFDKHMGYK
jgi:hypothetical protein